MNVTFIIDDSGSNVVHDVDGEATVLTDIMVEIGFSMALDMGKNLIIKAVNGVIEP